VQILFKFTISFLINSKRVAFFQRFSINNLLLHKILNSLFVIVFLFLLLFLLLFVHFQPIFFLAITNIKIPRVQVSNPPLHSNFNSRIIFFNLITYHCCHQTFSKLYFWKNHNNNSFGLRVFQSIHFISCIMI
jgi:hypothetical protein